MQLESPSSPRVIAEVDPSFAAQRASLFPWDHKNHAGTNIGGHYRRSLTTGNTTVLAAGAGLLSMRWTEPDRSFVLSRLKVAAVIVTAFGTAQEVGVDLVRVSNFTAADSAGTASTMGSEGKKGPNMGNSLIGDLRVAPAAGLTNGTGSAEATALSSLTLPIGNVAGAAAEGILFDTLPGVESPFILSRAPEGFRVRVKTLQGAAGVLYFTFTMDWMEVPSTLVSL